MREKRGLRAAVVALGLVAALAGACHAAEEASVRVQVGRRSMLLPPGYQASGERLARHLPETTRDGHVERVLVRITTPAHRHAWMLLETTDAVGLFQWTSGCSKLRSDEDSFVHSPFHANDEECVLAFGGVDLAEVMGRVVPDVAEPASRLGDDSVGYFIQAQYAKATGALLKVAVFAPDPFAGAAPGGPPPRNDSGLPDAIVAWALSLGAEVRSGVRSFSGDWRLPPINETE